MAGFREVSTFVTIYCIYRLDSDHTHTHTHTHSDYIMPTHTQIFDSDG